MIIFAMQKNQIPNWPTMKANILRAEDLFEQNLGWLKDKTTR